MLANVNTATGVGAAAPTQPDSDRSRSMERRKNERESRAAERNQSRTFRDQGKATARASAAPGAPSNTSANVSDLLEALRAYGVATESKLSEELAPVREDISELRDDIEECKDNITVCNRQFAELRREVDDFKKETRGAASIGHATVAGSSSGAGHATVFSTGDFVPSEVKLTNICRFKAPREEQLGRVPATALGAQMLAYLRPEHRHLVSLVPPARFNYQLRFRVLGGRPSCQVVANQFRQFVAANNVSYNGLEARVAIEMELERKAQFSLMYRARDLLQGLGYVEGQHVELEVLGKRFEIYIKGTDDILGSVQGNKWVWNPEECTKLGFNSAEHLVDVSMRARNGVEELVDKLQSLKINFDFVFIQELATQKSRWAFFDRGEARVRGHLLLANSAAPRDTAILFHKRHRHRQIERFCQEKSMVCRFTLADGQPVVVSSVHFPDTWNTDVPTYVRQVESWSNSLASNSRGRPLYAVGGDFNIQLAAAHGCRYVGPNTADGVDITARHWCIYEVLDRYRLRVHNTFSPDVQAFTGLDFNVIADSRWTYEGKHPRTRNIYRRQLDYVAGNYDGDAVVLYQVNINSDHLAVWNVGRDNRWAEPVSFVYHKKAARKSWIPDGDGEVLAFNRWVADRLTPDVCKTMCAIDDALSLATKVFPGKAPGTSQSGRASYGEALQELPALRAEILACMDAAQCATLAARLGRIERIARRRAAAVSSSWEAFERAHSKRSTFVLPRTLEVDGVANADPNLWPRSIQDFYMQKFAPVQRVNVATDYLLRLQSLLISHRCDGRVPLFRLPFVILMQARARLRLDASRPTADSPMAAMLAQLHFSNLWLLHSAFEQRINGTGFCDTVFAWINLTLYCIPKADNAWELKKWRPITIANQLQKFFETVLTLCIQGRSQPFPPLVYGMRRAYQCMDLVGGIQHVFNVCDEWNLQMVLGWADVWAAFDNIRCEVADQALDRRGTPLPLRVAACREMSGLQANIHLNGATCASPVPLLIAGRQGGSFTPECFNSIMADCLAPLVDSWIQRDMCLRHPPCLPCEVDADLVVPPLHVWVDNVYVISSNTTDMQTMLNETRHALEEAGLCYKLNSAGIMCSPAALHESVYSNVTLVCQGVQQTLRHVDSSVQLGITITSTSRVEGNVAGRLATFRSLWQRRQAALCSRRIPLWRRLKAYHEQLLSAVVYGAGCWGHLDSASARAINSLDLHCLRQMCKRRRRPHETFLEHLQRSTRFATDLRRRAKYSSLLVMCVDKIHQWYGHCARDSPDKLSKLVQEYGDSFWWARRQAWGNENDWDNRNCWRHLTTGPPKRRDDHWIRHVYGIKPLQSLWEDRNAWRQLQDNFTRHVVEQLLHRAPDNVLAELEFEGALGIVYVMPERPLFMPSRGLQMPQTIFFANRVGPLSKARAPLLSIQVDNDALAGQMSGRYAMCKQVTFEGNLVDDLFSLVCTFSLRIPKLRGSPIEWIPRERNEEADALANSAREKKHTSHRLDDYAVMAFQERLQREEDCALLLNTDGSFNDGTGGGGYVLRGLSSKDEKVFDIADGEVYDELICDAYQAECKGLVAGVACCFTVLEQMALHVNFC